MARFAEGIATFTARPDPSDGVRMLLQGSLEKRANAALIFDNQYFRGSGPSRFAPLNLRSYREPQAGSSIARIHPLMSEWHNAAKAGNVTGSLAALVATG